MAALPWWASWIVALLVRLLGDWSARLRAERAHRDLGAARERDAARAEAERQEAHARRAGAAAADAADDPRDLRD